MRRRCSPILQPSWTDHFDRDPVATLKNHLTVVAQLQPVFPLRRLAAPRHVRFGWDLRFAERLVDGYGSNMKASRQILRALFLFLKSLLFGFDLRFSRRLILDHPDMSLGGSRADLTL